MRAQGDAPKKRRKLRYIRPNGDARYGRRALMALRDKGVGLNGKVLINQARGDEHIEPQKSAKRDEYKGRRALKGTCTKGNAREEWRALRDGTTRALWLNSANSTSCSIILYCKHIFYFNY